MWKIWLMLITVVVFPVLGSAQSNDFKSNRTIAYELFIPAIITLESGKIIKERHANVSLKNGSLLYKNKGLNMQAEMSLIKQVDFTDRTYLKVDTMLAYIIDTLCNNKLLCVDLIDIETYKTDIINNRQITNLELGAHVNIATMDLTNIDEYPLINLYYYDIDGKIIKAQERIVQRNIPKEKRREFNAIINADGFSWDDSECLIKLLKIMQ